MATTSSILQLTLPDEFDKVDIKALTDNFSKIDAAVGQKVDKDADVVDDLTVDQSSEQKALHAHQGYVLNEKISDNSNRIKTLEDNNVTKDLIANNLTTDDPYKVLSAAQGVALLQLLQDSCTTHFAVLTAGEENWEDADNEDGYVQEIVVNGLLESDEPVVDLHIAGITEEEEEDGCYDEWGYVTNMTAAENKLIAYCKYYKPTVDLPIKIKVVR